MLRIELYQVAVSPNDNKVVITFSDSHDSATTTICHSRIDLEEHLHILCGALENHVAKQKLWVEAERCVVPNYHVTSPVIIEGYCGKYLNSALQFWGHTVRSRFKSLGQETWFEHTKNLPYSMLYKNCMTACEDSSNAMLILHDFLGDYEVYLVGNYEQLSEIVSKTPMLSAGHRTRILTRLDNDSILPKGGGLPLKSFKGDNAKLISSVLNTYNAARIQAAKYQSVAWSGYSDSN